MVTTGGAPRATIFGHLKGVRVEYCRYDSDRCRMYLFSVTASFLYPPAYVLPPPSLTIVQWDACMAKVWPLVWPQVLLWTIL